MTAIIQTSFSSGEISPTMYGRVDLAKYHVALAKCRNFFVDYRGGATSRAGTEYVFRTKTENPRLFSFQFNAVQNYVLEFGSNYIRFYQDGAPLIESSFAINSMTLGASTVIHVSGHNYIIGDWLYFQSGIGAEEINTRAYIIGTAVGDDLTLVDFDGSPVDSSSWTPYVSGATAARIYTVATPYAESDLATLRATQSQDIITLTHRNYRTRDLSRFAATNWELTVKSYDGQIEPPVAVVLTGAPVSGTAAENAYFSYCVTAVSAESGEESVASDIVTAECLNISTQAGSNKISWDRREGAAYYNVYKAQISPGQTVPVGSTYGYCGTAYGLEFIDGNIVADFTKVPPTRRDPFAPGQILNIVPTAGGTTYTQAATTATITDPTGTGARIAPIVTGDAVTAFLVLEPGINYSSPTVVITGDGSGFVLFSAKANVRFE